MKCDKCDKEAVKTYTWRFRTLKAEIPLCEEHFDKLISELQHFREKAEILKGR